MQFATHGYMNYSLHFTLYKSYRQDKNNTVSNKMTNEVSHRNEWPNNSNSLVPTLSIKLFCSSTKLALFLWRSSLKVLPDLIQIPR